MDVEGSLLTSLTYRVYTFLDLDMVNSKYLSNVSTLLVFNWSVVWF